MKRVGILGSGNVGSNTAFFIAEKHVADVALSDVLEGLQEGKALDIMEVAPIRSYRTRVRGVRPAEAVEGADIVVVAAGAARKPTMKREDLFEQNRAVVESAAQLVKQQAPRSSVVIVTEPVDLLTAVFTAESGLPRERVLGVGGLLDSTRLRFAVARDLGVSVETTSALCLGRHGPEMIAPARFTSVSGIPVLKLMSRDQFEALVEEVRSAGDFIVEMAQKGSAFYAPSAAIAELVDALCRDSRRVFSVSALLKGEYGIEGVALSLPAVVGERGVERFFIPQLTAEEQAHLKKSAEELRELLSRRRG